VISGKVVGIEGERFAATAACMRIHVRVTPVIWTNEKPEHRHSARRAFVIFVRENNQQLPSRVIATLDDTASGYVISIHVGTSEDLIYRRWFFFYPDHKPRRTSVKRSRIDQNTSTAMTLLAF
jgi:hypothetical protein